MHAISHIIYICVCVCCVRPLCAYLQAIPPLVYSLPRQGSKVMVLPVKVFTKICMADFRSARHKRQLEPTTFPVAATLHHDYYTDYTQKGSYNHDYHSIAHGGSYKITTVRRTSFYHFYLFG